MSIQPLQLGPDWRAGDFGPDLWKKCRSFLEPQHHGANEPGRPTVCFSRDGVRFMKERRRTTHPARQHWRRRGKAAHAENDLRFEFAIERSTDRKAAGKSPEKTEHGGRIKRWQPD